jgi:hypothetical protein
VAHAGRSARFESMCNLYRLDKGQDHLRRFFKVDRDDSGNQPPLPEIYPDQSAPSSGRPRVSGLWR